MKTYIYIESDSPQRGLNVRVTVYRIKNNQPHYVDSEDHHTKAWRGARPTACRIINRVDKLPMEDGYNLRDQLGFDELYTATKGRGVRLFNIGTY